MSCLVRLQQRDLDVLRDIGVNEVMGYSQILKMHFGSYDSCIKRLSALQKERYTNGAFYNTKEKVFILTKEGAKVLSDLLNQVYKIGNYSNVYHKLMRTELYCEVRDKGLTKWKNEVTVEEINKVFDVAFWIDDDLYLSEIHNEQKSNILAEKIEACLKIPYKFTLLIYTKNKNTVMNILEKLNKRGLDKQKRFDIKVFKYGDKVEL